MAAGSTVLSKGKRLGAAELGMLAALGIQIVPVQRTLRIAIFSTGDELQNPGQPLSQASVYDSNRFSLAALLNQFGTQVIDLGILADDPEAIKTALKNNIDQADVIISSGGVSIGAADFTKQVMQDLAQMHFWSVNMRPGRPLAFGNTPKSQSSGKTYLFGLPGNPVAMMVSFYFFVHCSYHRSTHYEKIRQDRVSARNLQRR
jgi:molybdopterin molybdotransferase